MRIEEGKAYVTCLAWDAKESELLVTGFWTLPGGQVCSYEIESS